MPPKKTLSKKTNGNDACRKIFVSSEQCDYPFAWGSIIPSAFTGFIAGILVSAMVWTVIIQAIFIE